MDDAGIEYILMLRTNFSKYDELADSVIDTIKSYKHKLRDENGDERIFFMLTAFSLARSESCSSDQRDASRDYPGQKWFDNPETHLDKER